MRRPIPALVSVLAGLVLSGPSVLGQASNPSVSRELTEGLSSLVTVVSVDESDQPLGLGSGFFISVDGVMVTHRQVIDGAPKLVLRWRGQMGVAERVLKFDPSYDLVVVQTSFRNTPVARLGAGSAVAVGQEVVVFDNPSGAQAVGWTGIVSGTREIQGAEYLQISVPVSPGSRGGPVLDTEGQVIAVASGVQAGRQHFNLAVPVEVLQHLPDAAIPFEQVRYAPPDADSVGDTDDLVYASNPIERYHGRELNSVTVSLQNKTNDTIGQFRTLLVVRDPVGQVLNYCLDDHEDLVVAPGLARQVTLYCPTEGFRTFPTQGSSRPAEPAGQYEVRVLDYRIVSPGGASLNQLLGSR